VLRDSRILSVVEKWSSEMMSANSAHSTELAAETSESADVTGDVEQEQEQDGSGTETRDVKSESEVIDSLEAKEPEAVGQDDAEIPPSSVSNHL